MKEESDKIVSIIKEKSSLKQDVFDKTKDAFSRMKIVLEEELTKL